MDDLLKKAMEYDITITYEKTNHVKSMAIQLEGDKYININESLIETDKEERWCIAHEIGHCIMQNSYYNIDTSIYARKRREYKADLAAAKLLVDIDELKNAIQEGIDTLWDLADFFDIPYEAMERTIQIYKNKGLLS